MNGSDLIGILQDSIDRGDHAGDMLRQLEDAGYFITRERPTDGCPDLSAHCLPRRRETRADYSSWSES